LLVDEKSVGCLIYCHSIALSLAVGNSIQTLVYFITHGWLAHITWLQNYNERSTDTFQNRVKHFFQICYHHHRQEDTSLTTKNTISIFLPDLLKTVFSLKIQSNIPQMSHKAFRNKIKHFFSMFILSRSCRGHLLTHNEQNFLKFLPTQT